MCTQAAHKDVQFYLEIEDGESLLDNRRRNQYDKDEIEDEEKQRKILSKLDKEFKNFCDRTHQQLPAKNRSDPEGDKIWDWDIPYNELMFQGSPKNQMVGYICTHTHTCTHAYAHAHAHAHACTHARKEYTNTRACMFYVYIFICMYIICIDRDT